MARFFQPKKKIQLNTKHQSFMIEKLDHHGAGIAYQNKKPIFIEGALPGEQVLGQLSENKSKFARANLIKVQKASEQRISPVCACYQECGGCNMQHLDIESQQQYKQQTLNQLMSKFAGQSIGLEAPILGPEQGYRRRTRISLKLNKKTRALEFGFRKKHSNEIVNVTHCPVLDSELDSLVEPLYLLLQTFSNQENLGHLELVKGDNTRVIVLRHLKPLAKQDRQSLQQFANQHQATLYLMPNSDQLEHIVGARAHYLEAGVTIPFEPNNFIQVNQSVNQAMVKQALNWLALTPQDRVLDLFCGLGNFSLPIAQKAAHVVGVEGVDTMVAQAKDNAALNAIDNAQFYQANLEQGVAGQPWAAEKFDKILLDPARSGANGVIEQISTLGASRIVYVSCNPATLARDSLSLLSQGYTLQKLGMLDMFPHTSHLESMALFVKD